MYNLSLGQVQQSLLFKHECPWFPIDGSILSHINCDRLCAGCNFHSCSSSFHSLQVEFSEEVCANKSELCVSLKCRRSSSSSPQAVNVMSFGFLVDKVLSRWGLKCIFWEGCWRGVTQEPVPWLICLLWTSKWPPTIIKTGFLKCLEAVFDKVGKAP